MREYTLKHFRADLKTVVQTTGLENKPCVLLLEDCQLRSRSFMELVNSLLSSGEVPGLFTAEELDPLLAPLRDSAAELGWRESLYQFMLSRVQHNLHVVLILDCTHEAFGFTCESNPALLARCSLQWLATWQEATMHEVRCGGRVEALLYLLGRA